MKKIKVVCVCLLSLLGWAVAEAEQPLPRVIVDMDIGSSTDDLFVFDAVRELEKNGYVKLIGVMVDRACPNDDDSDRFVGFTKAFMHSRHYNMDHVPIGTVPKLAPGQPAALEFSSYWKLAFPCDEEGRQWQTPLVPIPETRSGIVTNGVTLYRMLLADSPDKTVEICSVGFVSILMGLLDSPADDISSLSGRDLIAQKVKTLRIMAGCFDETLIHPEYNILGDLPAAKRIFSEWPSDIIVSPYELGVRAYLPRTPILRCMDLPDLTDHPIRLTYKNWDPDGVQGKKSQLLWDPFTAYGLITSTNFFTYTPRGRVNIYEKGGIDGYTSFEYDETGNVRIQQISSQSAIILRNYIQSVLSHTPVTPSQAATCPVRIIGIGGKTATRDDVLYIKNFGSVPYDLSGKHFTCGIPEKDLSVSYQFPAGSTIAPNETITLNGPQCWPGSEIPNDSVFAILWTEDWDVLHDTYCNSIWYKDFISPDSIAVAQTILALQVEADNWRVGCENAHFTKDISVPAKIGFDADRSPVIDPIDGTLMNAVDVWSKKNLTDRWWTAPCNYKFHRFFRLTRQAEQ